MTLAALQTNGHNPYLPEPEREEQGEPDIGYVLNLYKNYSFYYQPFHNQCRTADTYYFGQNLVPVVEGADVVRPGTAQAKIDTATDHVDVANLEIEVPSGPRSRARGERLKKFYLGCWMSIKDPVLRTSVKHQFQYGISWKKVTFVPDMWPNPPTLSQYSNEDEYKTALSDVMDARCINFPLNVENVNPKNMIWDDSRARRQWAIEFYQMPAHSIRRLYPEWHSDKKGQESALWLQYCDENWYGYIADNEWVWGPELHGNGFMQYIPAMPGAAMDFDVGPPHLRYRGLITPITGLLDSEARLMTKYEAITHQIAYTTLDFHGPAREAKQAMEEYVTIGGHNVIPSSVTVKASPRQQIPPELLGQLNLVQNAIEANTYPDIIRGVRPKGVSAGYAMSVLAGVGRLKFAGVAAGEARSIELCNQGFAKLVENRIRGRITVQARSDIHNFDQTIGPEDIKGLYENKVTLKAQAPEEREREALLAMRLKEADMLSRYTAQKWAGISNPLEETNQMAAEKILASPEFTSEQIRIALEGMGLLQQLADAAGASPQGGVNVGNQFLGLSQGPRLGEKNIQQARVASRAGQPSVFPRGLPGMDAIAKRISTPTGGAQGMPSGQTIRR